MSGFLFTIPGTSHPLDYEELNGMMTGEIPPQCPICDTTMATGTAGNYLCPHCQYVIDKPERVEVIERYDRTHSKKIGAISTLSALLKFKS
jgi:uncharacterized Zn finger protein (UPF0148 family)